jgi:hypothetical protein
MKGMLTGPITCLRWSFPRDDVHQSVQAQQLALALEVGGASVTSAEGQTLTESGLVDLDHSDASGLEVISLVPPL